MKIRLLLVNFTKRGLDCLLEEGIRLGSSDKLAIDQKARCASHARSKAILQIFNNLVAVFITLYTATKNIHIQTKGICQLE